MHMFIHIHTYIHTCVHIYTHTGNTYILSSMLTRTQAEFVNII